jgi:hypothetical protein
MVIGKNQESIPSVGQVRLRGFKFNEGETPMPNKTKKGKHDDKKTIKPASKENEISDKDLEKVVGGLNPQPLPPRWDTKG